MHGHFQTAIENLPLTVSCCKGCCWLWSISLTLDYLLLDDFLSTQSSHTVSQEAGPLKKYDETVRSGKLKLDRYQRQIVEHLQRLHDDVVNYQPTSSGFFSKVRNMVHLLKNSELNLYCSQLEEIFPVHKSWSKS